MSGPNQSPVFTRDVVVGRGKLTVANTGLDGTGTLVSLLTGSLDGTRIDRIVITALVTTAAGMVRFFIDDLTLKYLVKEVPVTVVAPSGTVPAFTAELTRSDGLPVLHLPSGFILKASTQIANAFDVVCFSGNY